MVPDGVEFDGRRDLHLPGHALAGVSQGVDLHHPGPARPRPQTAAALESECYVTESDDGVPTSVKFDPPLGPRMERANRALS